MLLGPDVCSRAAVSALLYSSLRSVDHQVWFFTPVILGLERLRQEDGKFVTHRVRSQITKRDMMDARLPVCVCVRACSPVAGWRPAGVSRCPPPLHYVYLLVHTAGHTHEVRGHLAGVISSLPLWVLGTELRASGLVAHTCLYLLNHLNGCELLRLIFSI